MAAGSERHRLNEPPWRSWGGTRHKNGSFDKFLMGKWGKTVAFVCSYSGFWWGKQWESTQICKIIDFDRRVWVLADKLWRGRVFGFGHISVFGYVPAKNFKIEDMLEFTFRLVWYIWSAYIWIYSTTGLINPCEDDWCGWSCGRFTGEPPIPNSNSFKINMFAG